MLFDTSEKVLELDSLRIKALLNRDVQTLRSLVHPDLIYTHSSARQDTFASYINGVENGLTVYRSIERIAVRTLAVPCGWILDGQVDLDVQIAGVDKKMRNRFLAFWLCESTKCRLLSWASTRLSSAT
ncbi:MAG: nuclear transport factor 2 family protein [Burkholderiaceae bacterium]